MKYLATRYPRLSGISFLFLFSAATAMEVAPVVARTSSSSDQTDVTKKFIERTQQICVSLAERARRRGDEWTAKQLESIERLSIDQGSRKVVLASFFICAFITVFIVMLCYDKPMLKKFFERVDPLTIIVICILVPMMVTISSSGTKRYRRRKIIVDQLRHGACTLAALEQVDACLEMVKDESVAITAIHEAWVAFCDKEIVGARLDGAPYTVFRSLDAFYVGYIKTIDRPCKDLREQTEAMIDCVLHETRRNRDLRALFAAMGEEGDEFALNNLLESLCAKLRRRVSAASAN